MVTKPPLTLSPQKRRIFWTITISLPVVILLILEIGLQIFNYGGNLDVFIDGPPGYDKYLRCNPNVARRYFYIQTKVPNPPKQLFLKQKPSNGFRIFVLGESSAAGFPYSTNVSFPNILERGLANTFPEKNIEVINISITAINSYTLLNLVDELLEQSPDALFIYTGHNEYYGALGVGSVQSIGNWPWLINTFLKFQSIKIVLLMRDALGLLKTQFNRIFHKESESDPSATLMERIVSAQTIPYGSSLYEAGKKQFENNIESILIRSARKDVPVVLSELVSNIRDQEPFISVADKEGHSAIHFFKLARQFEQNGEFEKAKHNYYLAKDLDALRFRAAEDFNTILHKLADKYNLAIVPTISYFEKESPHGLIGNSLMLEHLHPNKAGYFLLARAFYETMQSHHMISAHWPGNGLIQEWNQGITELDSVYAALSIRALKAGWPFQPKSSPNRFLQTFRAQNQIEEIAFRVLHSKNFSLESAHMELGQIYEQQNKLDQAFLEYNALITSIPHEIEFYQKAGLILIAQKKFEEAAHLLRRSLKYKDNKFANKWIGQIAYMQNDYKSAISFLMQADLQDPQVLFNLSRAFYFNGQWENGEAYYLQLRKLTPRSEYVIYLSNLRTSLETQRYKLKQNYTK
jgi:tetratricopeptide (TPR) repeat protein